MSGFPGISYYQMIAEDIERTIKSGELNPGDMLDSENRLAKKYSTSRVTVRKSLAILEEGGLIKPQQGKGYFVCSPAHEDFKLSFSDTGEGQGEPFSYIRAMKPDDTIRRELALSQGQLVIGICRVIKKDGRPAAVDYKYIPHEKGKPSIEAEIDYAVFPAIAAAKSAPFAFHTEMSILPELPSEEVCKFLSCDPSTPLLAVYRRLIDLDGNPVGFGVRYQTSDFGPMTAISGYEAENNGNRKGPRKD